MGSASKNKVREALESMPHARSCMCDHKEVDARSCICDYEQVRMLTSSRLLRTFKAYSGDTEIVSPFTRVGTLLGSAFGGDRPVHKIRRQKYSLRKMFELVNLRYLVVEVHWFDEFSSSVGLLWNLQTLVVARSRNIEAPVEIWKMTQLRHVHFCNPTVPWSGFKKGSLYLPDPPSDYVVMENLQTLKGVRNLKCSEELVRRILNIKKLEIQYEEVKGNHELSDDYYCLANLECLRKLESFTCHVHWNEPFKQKLSFPVSLRKLSLLYIKLSEDMMEKIGSLPLLQKLKLEGGSFFETGKWETVEGQFRSLKFLSLKSCVKLKEWVMEESSHFPCLEQLRLFGLEDLEEIPAEIGDIPTLQSIQLHHCYLSLSLFPFFC